MWEYGDMYTKFYQSNKYIFVQYIIDIYLQNVYT